MTETDGEAQWTGPVEAHPLDSARGKIVRAVQQARHLCDHCDAYGSTQPMKLRASYDNEGGGYLVYLEGRRPPLYLGMILGEVIHDLRSALDHTAWQLALQHVGADVLSQPNNARLVVFPITSTKAEFDRHRAVGYFSPKAAAQIETFQPYHNADEGSPLVNPLALVQDLSNADKHRALTPSVGQLRLEELQIGSTETLADDAVELIAPENSIIGADTPFLRVRVSPQVHVEFAPPPVHVRFHTEITGEPDLIFPERTPRLCELIGEAVNSFERFFPPVDLSERFESWTTPDLNA